MKCYLNKFLKINSIQYSVCEEKFTFTSSFEINAHDSLKFKLASRYIIRINAQYQFNFSIIFFLLLSVLYEKFTTICISVLYISGITECIFEYIFVNIGTFQICFFFCECLLPNKWTTMNGISNPNYIC